MTRIQLLCMRRSLSLHLGKPLLLAALFLGIGVLSTFSENTAQKANLLPAETEKEKCLLPEKEEIRNCQLPSGAAGKQIWICSAEFKWEEWGTCMEAKTPER